MGADEIESIKGIASLGLKARLSVWCRADMKDLRAAWACKVHAVYISFPVSDILLSSIGRDRLWALRSVGRYVRKAKKWFPLAYIGAPDASRAHLPFLEAFAYTVRENGADRLRLADTVGILAPGGTLSLVERIRRAAPGLEIEFHAHNDLGLATANTLAALEGGAHCVSVTVNGLGERSGNAALEEVAMALKVGLGVDPGLRTEGLTALSRQVALASGRPLPPGKPVTGPAAFRHESGVHAAAALRESGAYEPFDPRTVGQETSFVMGKHSGLGLLEHVLGLPRHGLKPEEGKRVLKKVRREAVRLKRSLTVEEVERLCGSLETAQSVP
jgi:homocitrate synthase NifV